jgi:hypothetical protein
VLSNSNNNGNCKTDRQDAKGTKDGNSNDNGQIRYCAANDTSRTAVKTPLKPELRTKIQPA